MVTERAAIGLLTYLDLDKREAYNMHDGEKLGQAATGKLIRPKNKRVLNPFPSGVALMNLSTKVEKFIYRTRINNIHKICETIKYPIIKPNM